MNYIQQAFKGQHQWWHYLIGFVIILIAWQFIGSLPLLIALIMAMMKSGNGLQNMPSEISELTNLLGQNTFLTLMLVSFLIGLIGLFFVIKVIHRKSRSSSFPITQL